MKDVGVSNGLLILCVALCFVVRVETEVLGRRDECMDSPPQSVDGADSSDLTNGLPC